MGDANAHCRGKTGYLSWGAAAKALRYMHVKRTRAEGKVGPYRCRFCPHWHLGHGRR